MKQRKLGIVTAAGMVLIAGTAMALTQPQQPESFRQSVRLAERLSSLDVNLAQAIKTAEEHSKGVAVAVRLTTTRAYLESDSHQNRWQDGGSQDRNWQDRDARDRGQQGRDTQDRMRQDREAREREAREREARERGQQGRDAQGRDAQGRDAQGRTTQDRGTQTNPMSGDQTGAAQPRSGDRTETSRDQRQPVSESADSLFAVVTCVVDRVRVRDVIVDMRNNTALGYRSIEMQTGSFDRHSGSYSEDDQQRFNGMSSQVSQVRATVLMNATVRNNEGDRIGEIDDLAVDPNNNRVVYGVLRRGGFLGMGESRYAVSSNELASLRNGRVFMNLSDSDFRGQSGFSNDNWPTKADPQWNTRWDSESASADAPPATRVVKGSSLIGTKVTSSDGKAFGKIEDLIVDTRTGRVSYAILSCDRGEMAVPMTALESRGDAYTMRMPLEQLNQRPVFEKGEEPDWNDARWNRRVHESFGVRSIHQDTQSRDRNPR
jgi:sporulation protein YlmC with PRC-barrel domain